MIWLIIKPLTELQKFQKNHKKIIQKQLQMIKIPKERYIYIYIYIYIYPEERQKITENLRLK